MGIENIQKQKNEWKRKGWSIPELRGRKQDWFAIVVELVEILDKNSVVDLRIHCLTCLLLIHRIHGVFILHF